MAGCLPGRWPGCSLRRMLSIGSIVIRVDNLERQMNFWQAALGFEPRYAPDGDFVILQPPGGAGTCISLDRVPAPVQIPRACIWTSTQTSRTPKCSGSWPWAPPGWSGASGRRTPTT